MAKDTITKDGVEMVVPETTAKAFRFVRWGTATAVIVLGIMAVAAVVLFFW